MIINLFCDASIDTSKRIACGGVHVACQDDVNMTMYPMATEALIQLNATNNSSEILAIWYAINRALKIRRYRPEAIFRLFSDSKISIYGLRSWIINWVKGINPDDPCKILYSSSGEPVMNQQRFIDIFNTIIKNNLRIEFYHQRGHVGDKDISLHKARVDFIKSNKVSPENLGLDIAYLSQCNNFIDNFTRSSLKMYINSGELEKGVQMDLPDPMFHYIMDDKLNQYVRCIDKTTVISRHDFKGGYNQ